METVRDTPATLEAMVREKIRSDILSGELEPNARLRIKRLSERYAVGGSPLREALSRLVPEGLIAIEENRGFRVAPLSIAELIEITEMRQIIEVQAFRRALRNGDDRWEAGIVAAYHQLAKLVRRPSPDPRAYRLEWEARHRAFHLALLSACGNRRLLRAADQLYENLGRYRSVLQVNDLDPARLSEIHRELTELALARDAARGGRVLANHFEVNIEQLEENLRREPGMLERLQAQPPSASRVRLRTDTGRSDG